MTFDSDTTKTATLSGRKKSLDPLDPSAIMPDGVPIGYLLPVFVFILIVFVSASYFVGTDLIGGRFDQSHHQWQTKQAAVAQARRVMVKTLEETMVRRAQTLARYELVRLFAAESSLAVDQASNPRVSAQLPYLKVMFNDYARDNELIGLSLLDFSGEVQIIASTSTELDLLVPEQSLASVMANGVPIHTIPRIINQRVIMSVLVPVYEVQQPNTSGRDGIAGAIVLHRDVSTELLEVLAPLPLSSAQEGTRLLFNDGGWQELSISEGQLLISAGGPSVDARVTGHMIKMGDIQSEALFATYVRNKDSHWVIREDVLRSHAMSSAHDFRKSLVTVFLLILGLLTLSGLLIWRSAASSRNRALALQYSRYAMEIENHELLLTAVLDSIPDYIGVKDVHGHYFQINLAIRERIGRSGSDQSPLTEADVFGRAHADVLEQADRYVIETCEPQKVDFDTLDGRNFSSVRAPFHTTAGTLGGVVTMTRDVTESIQTKKRVNSATRATVAALSKALESGDRVFNGHSIRVAEIARSLAERCGLSSSEATTCYLAGSLIGAVRIGLPDELLHKHTELSADERRYLRSRVSDVHQLLEGIEFELPVVEVLERLGKTDAELDEHLRKMVQVLTLANAWCAMTSDRDWRKAMSEDDALAKLHAHPEQYPTDLIDIFRA